MQLTKELLKEKYKEYNATYFNNELKMCKFSLYATSTELGLYTRGRIWMAKRPKNVEKLEWDEQLFKETFVHEMVHHYVCTVKGKRTFLCPHGLKFRCKCSEIKRSTVCVCSIPFTLSVMPCWTGVRPSLLSTDWSCSI